MPDETRPLDGHDPALREMKLPCDVAIGSVLFRRGVSVHTLLIAAERWYAMASPPKLDRIEIARQNLRAAIDDLGRAEELPNG